jgi:NNP family nitrate/nitrite transporter-like MFS transporter
MMRVMQVRWTRTWAEKGGRARVSLVSSAGNTGRGAHRAA